MKTLILLLFGLSALVCFSCGESNTELSVNNTGFSIDEAYLVGPDNTKKADNKVPMNSSMAIVVEGIDNYELKDGKAFPGLMLTVTDEDGNAVLDEPDMLANNDGFDPKEAAVLRGEVKVGNPMESGETYHVKMRVWDKNKFENEIVAEVDIEVE